MIQFLALLPTLLGALSAAPKVFEAGKAIVETVTGKAVPETATPKDLIEHIKTLPPEQAEAIVDGPDHHPREAARARRNPAHDHAALAGQIRDADHRSAGPGRVRRLHPHVAQRDLPRC